MIPICYHLQHYSNIQLQDVTEYDTLIHYWWNITKTWWCWYWAYAYSPRDLASWYLTIPQCIFVSIWFIASVKVFEMHQAALFKINIASGIHYNIATGEFLLIITIYFFFWVNHVTIVFWELFSILGVTKSPYEVGIHFLSLR